MIEYINKQANSVRRCNFTATTTNPHPCPYGAPTWTMHSESTAGFVNFMTQKKIIKKLQERIEELEAQKNTAEQKLQQIQKEHENLKSNARVSDEQSTMYKEQNTKLQQDFKQSRIENQQLASKIQEFEGDSSILQYIWNKTLQEMEFCMSTYGAWEELQIANTQNKIVQATNFVQYLYKELYAYIIHYNVLSSQNDGLYEMNNCMNLQMKKLQALIHEQEFSGIDRDKFNKLMAKLLFVFYYTDIIVLVSKFGFTGRFYEEYRKKLIALNRATVELASEDITKERKPLCIMYKSYIYAGLDKIISGHFGTQWVFKIAESNAIGDKMKEKFEYPNKEKDYSSIVYQFEEYIDE